MNKFFLGALALILLASAVWAQSDDGARPAPNVIQIYREVVKPGHTVAHEKTEMGWPKAYKASKASARYLAMTTITGQSEAWFTSGYDSYEAWEKQLQAERADARLSAELSRLSAADGEHLENWRSITARYREGLSLRPPLNIGSYRYMNIVTIRVRPGMQSKFEESRRILKAAHEKAGLKDYYSIFEVNSGMVAPTFLLFIPMKSLKDADDAVAMHAAAAYREALGGEEGNKKLAELNAAAIISNESILLEFNPKMSNPPDNYMKGGNADYWSPKPAAPKAAPAKKD